MTHESPDVSRCRESAIRIRRMLSVALPVLAAVTLLTTSSPVAAGQDSESQCFFVCAPGLKVEPTFTFEPVFRRPVVEDVDAEVDMDPGRVGTERVFELIFAVGIPTTVPRLGFTFETIFIPSGDVDANPFTGVTANELGRASLRGNEIEVELEVNLGLLDPEQTGGWVESHFDVVDKISAAERPTDTSAYTHKLNFEWDTAFRVFSSLSDGHWLRGVEIEGSLDYVATGVARAGDIVGNTRFVTDDSRWSFSLVFVVPLTP